MAQVMVPVSQIEEVARRVFGEQAERLRQELWQEMVARSPRRSETEERVWEVLHELAQAQARTEVEFREFRANPRSGSRG
jgi:arginine deiminase